MLHQKMMISQRNNHLIQKQSSRPKRHALLLAKRYYSKKLLCFKCSETACRDETKTPESWSFEIENSIILKFLKNASSKVMISRRNKHLVQKQSSRSKQACFVTSKTIL